MRTFLQTQLLSQIAMCGLSSLILAICLYEPLEEVKTYTNTLFFLHFICAPIIGALLWCGLNYNVLLDLWRDWINGINEYR